MEFYDTYNELKTFDIQGFLDNVGRNDVARIVQKTSLVAEDFLALLSPAALEHLESMAQKAHEITQRQFGPSMLLFTPLYLSNYCVNQCIYCGFNTCHTIDRRQLSLEQVRAEAETIAQTGLKHILILTGEDREHAGLDYLKACCQVLKDYFSSICIEIYALTTEEYHILVENGVDGLTIYQETYNETLYDAYHKKGPKKDYRFRLGAPERGCRAGMRSVNIGALLGLDEWRQDVFMMGMHAAWLQKHYPEVDISVSLPRIRPQTGGFQSRHVIDDRELVQVMTALRMFLPRCGITISTRENADFRDNISKLGVTKMSAGSTTVVGGHSLGQAGDNKRRGQFEIADERSVAEMCAALERQHIQPVYKDWEPIA